MSKINDMANSLHIEKANDQDIDAIAKLYKDINLNEFADYIGQDKVESFIASGAHKEEIIEYLDQIFVIKNESEQLLGFMILIENLIELMIINPEYQRQGLGKRLYQFAVKQIVNKYDTLKVECFAANKRMVEIMKTHRFSLLDEYVDDMGIPIITYIKENITMNTKTTQTNKKTVIKKFGK